MATITFKKGDEYLARLSKLDVMTRDKVVGPAIYTAADVFVNPTFEDNYPTVNLEAQACGTRVITYATGGAPETIWRADSCVVPAGDLEALKKRIEEGWQ